MTTIERQLVYRALDQNGRVPLTNLICGRCWMEANPDMVELTGEIVIDGRG